MDARSDSDTADTHRFSKKQNVKHFASKIPTASPLEPRLLQIGEADARSLKKIKRRRIEYTSSIYFFESDNADARLFAKDEETGLYYYGARYLDPKYSRWMSGDPAMGDYVPKAPINDEAKKHNEKLPGMGGVFNTVNLHTYHYAGNNPVKDTDPTGMYDKDTYDSLNRKEKNIVFSSISKAKAMNQIRIEAFTLQASIPKFIMSEDGTKLSANSPFGIYGGQGDAFRHAFWMAKSTQKLGEDYAKKFGIAHEYSTIINSFTEADIRMDIHNNAVGISIAKANPNATSDELKALILKEIETGQMLIVDQSKNKLYKSNDVERKNPIEFGDPFIRLENISKKILKEILK